MRNQGAELNAASPSFLVSLLLFLVFAVIFILDFQV